MTLTPSDTSPLPNTSPLNISRTRTISEPLILHTDSRTNNTPPGPPICHHNITPRSKKSLAYLETSPTHKLTRRISRSTHPTYSSERSSSQPNHSPKPNNISLAIPSSQGTKYLNVSDEGIYHLDKAGKSKVHLIPNFLGTNQSNLQFMEIEQNHSRTLTGHSFVNKAGKRFNQNTLRQKTLISYNPPETGSNEHFPLFPLSEDNSLTTLVDRTSTYLSLQHNIPVNFNNITISKFQSKTDYTRYHAHDQNLLGPNPTTCMISLGASQTVSFRKNIGSKVTHQFVLNAGSLLVMSGDVHTTFKHSILKPIVNKDTIIITMKSKIMSPPQMQIPASITNNPTSASTYLEDDIENLGPELSEVNSSFSTITPNSPMDPNTDNSSPQFTKTQSTNMTTPDEQVSYTDPTAMNSPIKSTQFTSMLFTDAHNSSTQSQDTQLPDPPFKSKLFHDSDSESDYSNDSDEDIPKSIKSNPLSLISSTISNCLQHMSHRQLSKELTRYNISTTGDLEKKRNRLELVITHSLYHHNSNNSIHHSSKPTKKHKPHLPKADSPPNSQLQQITTTLNNMEQTMKTLSDRIDILSIPDSKAQPTNKQNKNKTPIQNTDLNAQLELQTANLYQIQESNKQIEELLQKSEQSINQLNNSISDIRQLKTDLTTWHNSLFYSEDSNRIKEIHQKTSEILSKSHAALTPQLTDLDDKVHALEESFIECPCTSRSQIDNALSNIRHELHLDPQHHPTETWGNITHRTQDGGDFATHSQTEHQDHNGDYSAALLTSEPPHHNTTRPNEHTEPHNSQAHPTHHPPIEQGPKTTILITDSLMRHIEETDLGTGHELIKINKRCMSQLRNPDLVDQIKTISPNYIYIHLGINDLQQNSHPNDISDHLEHFLNATSTLQSTKVIISLPLLTGYNFQHDDIHLLRNNIINLIEHIAATYPQEANRLYYNENINFLDRFNRNQQDTSKFNIHLGDPVHLNNKGKSSILANLRYVIHKLTKNSHSTYRNQP